jgi:hypothetical protein
VHETVSEVQWNKKSKRVEVALRLDILDEQWIETRFSDDTEEDWRGEFLASRIGFDERDANRADSKASSHPIKWIGRKEEGGHVWWFFEAVCKDGKPPTSIQMRLLFDRDPNYQHRIIVLEKTDTGDRARRSVVLSQKKPKSTLRLVN